MPSRFVRTVAFLASWLWMFAANADWINLTGAETSPNIAEIYVLDNRVKLVLQVYIGDLETFEELIPDDWLKDLNVQRPTLKVWRVCFLPAWR
ncbi:MAG: hypothetical protein V3S73_04440 [Gammaproteobacteria bacterium]